MRTSAKLCAAALSLGCIFCAAADVHYVDVNSANTTPPYSSWATAATNIQDAIDVAAPGDELLVTNGVYTIGGHVVGRVANRVAVDKPLNIRSVNGPLFTTIRGGGSRCVYLTDGASLLGFTLTNGFAGGAGFSDPSGGGGGAYGGTLNNCILTGNSAEGVGGGACNSTLNNCALAGNRAGVFGGGAANCALNNCTLTGNSGYYGGATYGCLMNNCTLIGNSAGAGFGGGAYGGTLNNCIVYFNTATNDANFSTSQFVAVLNYSSTTPLPAGGVGNITNAPLFVDQASENLRLQPNSPCINAGNNSYVTGPTDLDANPRIVGRTVDIGAYEYQSLDLVGFGVVSNRFGFNITGQSNWVIVLEASSDFANWNSITTNTLSDSPVRFSDSTPSDLLQHFYRARMK